MAIRVLWVEDEPKVLRYERIVARNAGWQITDVDNTEQALELANRNTYDLVLLDMILPKDEYGRNMGLVNPETGLAFLDKLKAPTRQGATLHSVETVVITAVITAERRRRIMDHLSCDRYYLPKGDYGRERFDALVEELTRKLS